MATTVDLVFNDFNPVNGVFDFNEDANRNGVLDAGEDLNANGFDTTYGGAGPQFYGDGVLAKMELQPLGVSAFGIPTNACTGAIRLTGLGESKAGNSAFSVACVGAPRGAVGALAVGSGGSSPGIPLLGVTVYVDLGQWYVLKPGIADALGYGEFALPLPAGAAGFKAFVQAGWIDTGGCTGSLALSASEALKINIAGP
jgi:hypothetical protein